MAAPGKAAVKEIWDRHAEALSVELGQLSEQNATIEPMETASKAQQELERIERQIGQLAAVATGNEEATRRLSQLHEQVRVLREQLKTQRAAWQKTELARHPQRPYFLDYVENMLSDFSEIHGDRGFADDPALICGMARFRGEEVMVLGQQKGRDVKQRVYRNFGQASPEGYRKALRCMKLAEKFGRPLLSFIDTPGAFPGLGAEERGQAEAIARNLREMARLEVPIIVTITGEGGSGGALAIAIGDRILMLENSIYSVISPEGCASIMWRDAKKRETAAEALRITAQDQLGLGIIDEIVKEPDGGAHNDAKAAADLLGDAIEKNLAQLKRVPGRQLVESRYDKFRKMAQFFVAS
jgi:acetyl-CoA carboxylase carboxyl transferase subunit alpha